jgi:DNA-binding CsgD family transcriptional regulator
LVLVGPGEVLRLGTVTARSRLSGRELEITALLAQDSYPEAIAEELGLSVSTVRRSIACAIGKTGALTVTGLVVYALRQGLVPLAPCATEGEM